ncbi:NAD-dependent epimerase/dehydratase family protein [Ramlibacter alkalitolerans]|jgi:UDP-glucuronate 4-epimerase|uniref:NAD-dependent epimerase/dehydratase family protein n=1 Tax=Ramlibacter alkalitolerans TaxID=2039631 RepID=A0ABS1JTK1_9BURK|nr:NAD-dependent epimerase/dehydratase family protein [Ramlibacter alkalitolerans]MBL0427578.1 NAD-dependent epimerase/dehydratase family protein [Ramlibacter alkalitolerans]
MKILLTGAAGFIGMHVALRLLARGDEVVGIDNLNDYYDPALKLARLARLRAHPDFRFEQVSLEDGMALSEAFHRATPQRVVHLAAQVGVRHSVVAPHASAGSNLQGFVNVLEGCRAMRVEHLVYASSSSVYGANAQLPYVEEQGVDHPMSLYAATKRANELMAHAYSHLFRIPTTGVRFFTVYGPWGRPDMAMFRFTKAILEGQPLDLYNDGNMVRDFTYVDDVADPVLRLLDKPATPDPAFDPARPDPVSSDAPFRVFNVGGGHPVHLLELISALEDTLGRKAQRRLMPLQPGDVLATGANTQRLHDWIGPCPATPLRVGLRRFADWYLTSYQGAARA